MVALQPWGTYSFVYCSLVASPFERTSVCQYALAGRTTFIWKNLCNLPFFFCWIWRRHLTQMLLDLEQQKWQWGGRGMPWTSFPEHWEGTVGKPFSRRTWWDMFSGVSARCAIMLFWQFHCDYSKLCHTLLWSFNLHCKMNSLWVSCCHFKKSRCREITSMQRPHFSRMKKSDWLYKQQKALCRRRLLLLLQKLTHTTVVGNPAFMTSCFGWYSRMKSVLYAMYLSFQAVFSPKIIFLN